MALERRTLVLLGVLAIVMAAAGVYYRGQAQTGAQLASAPNARGQRASAAGQDAIKAPDVHLESLDAPHPRPDDAARNLFRFEPKVVARPGPAPVTAPPAPVRPAAPQPPPIPPITLKFVGLLETTSERIASLSDGRGITLGREGEIVLGRYKIWRIGTDSIDLSYVDGTGRTTIRLTGQ